MSESHGDARRCRGEFPADPSFLVPARLFTISVCRTWGLDDEVIADIRLGVSELAAVAAARAESFSIDLEHLGREVLLTVAPIDRADLEGVPVGAGDVVGALFDRVLIGGDRVVAVVERQE